MLRNEKDISINELSVSPVWEFAYEEAKMMKLMEIPLKPSVILPKYDIHTKRYLVKTIYTISNGVTFIGYSKPCDNFNTSISTLMPYDFSPVILTLNGRISFCYGIGKPGRSKLNINYGLFGYHASEIFPIHFKLDVDTINCFSSGIINGFMYFKTKDKNEVFRLEQNDIKFVV